MNQKNITFARNLVKGKIAETVFAQMFREMKHYTVLDFGYERIIPELVQQGYGEHDEELETLKTAPDFAVVNRITKEVRLIEVKYRSTIRASEILKCAERMANSWDPSWLFLATQEGFYFDRVDLICKNGGKLDKLSTETIPFETQVEYLHVLRDFEKTDPVVCPVK